MTEGGWGVHKNTLVEYGTDLCERVVGESGNFIGSRWYRWDGGRDVDACDYYVVIIALANGVRVDGFGVVGVLK